MLDPCKNWIFIHNSQDTMTLKEAHHELDAIKHSKPRICIKLKLCMRWAGTEATVARCDIHREFSLSFCFVLIWQQYLELVGVKFFRDFGELQQFLGVILRNHCFCTVRDLVSAALSFQQLPPDVGNTLIFLCWACQDSVNCNSFSKLLFVWFFSPLELLNWL